VKIELSIIVEGSIFLENGPRPVYDYELPKIAKALKVTVEWLLSEPKQSSASIAAEMRILSAHSESLG
jgi:hypothetical protein